jgi:hypothetical protein
MAGCCEDDNEHPCCIRREISWLRGQVLVSQEGPFHGVITKKPTSENFTTQ